MSQLKTDKLEQEKYAASLTSGIEQIAAVVDPSASSIVAVLQQEAATALQKLQDIVRKDYQTILMPLHTSF